MQIDYSPLQEIIGDRDRLILDNLPEQYQSDALGRVKGRAEALVFPLSTREVSEVMAFAHENRIPVTPRGAGTNLVGSTVPIQGGIVLDMSRMNRVLELGRETFTITVEPGITLQQVQTYVEERGLFYPPDPGEKEASIGGNISTNAGGMRAVKYGVTRDYVRGLELVLANGTVLTVGSKNVKDASGLALTQLIVGAEGTLAVITKCLLKVLPKPETTLSVLVPYGDLHTGISHVLNILQSGANPTAVEFVQRSVIAWGEGFLHTQFPYSQAASYLLLTFDGRREEVLANADRVRELVLAGGALDFLTLDDPDLAADVWRVRGALVNAVEAVSEQEPVDIVVPINRTAEFVGFIEKLEAKTGMQMVSFGHAGDGNVHLCVVRGDRTAEVWERELKANLGEAYAEAYRLGGLTSGEHGIGVSKRGYYLGETDKVNLEVMNKIKDALDERRILNDQKSYVL